MTTDDETHRTRRKYRDKRTERFASGERVKEFQSFEKQAYRRLEVVEADLNKEN